MPRRRISDINVFKDSGAALCYKVKHEGESERAHCAACFPVGCGGLGAIPETRSGSEEILEAAHRHCFRNRKEVLASDRCGCFYCGRIFNPQEISEWHDDGETAFCPHCGIDAIIGSAASLPLTAEFLDRVNRYWF